MPKYRVGWTYEEGGFCVVEADSEEEAEAKVFQHLEDEGNYDFDQISEHYDIVHRDYNTQDTEEIDDE